MFNKRLLSKVNSTDQAKALVLTSINECHGIDCHIHKQVCSCSCSMFVYPSIIDRKTNDDRYYVYSPYCLDVESLIHTIAKQGGD